MSTTSNERARGTDNYSGTAVGVIAFAAIFMIIGGAGQVIQGIVALVNDSFYAVGQEYIFEFDVTTWGWIHLLLGGVITFAGFALFEGAGWARFVAVLVAAVGILANFLWLPYYPVWSMTLIAFGVFVIWAVTWHGWDIRSV
jgi:hypothetical protein